MLATKLFKVFSLLGAVLTAKKQNWHSMSHFSDRNDGGCYSPQAKVSKTNCRALLPMASTAASLRDAASRCGVGGKEIKVSWGLKLDF